MTVEERYEALLSDIRELIRRGKTSVKSYEKMLEIDPNSTYAKDGLERAQYNIIMYEDLLRKDWERKFDLKRD